MYNLFKKIIYTGSLIGLTSFTNVATAADPLDSFTVVDFKFSLTDPAFGDMFTFGGATPIGSSPWGTLVEGTYQGTNHTNEIVAFNFFGKVVNVYTAAANHGPSGVFTGPPVVYEFGGGTAAGSVTGGPEPTIDLVNLTADMSSWFAEWSGTEFLQGNNDVFTACSTHPNLGFLSSEVDVVDNLDGTYQVNWSSCIGAPPTSSFFGQIGFWQLTLFCDTCVTVNPAPADSLSAVQGGPVTRTVTTTGGNVDITSSLGVAPANHVFAWVSESDAGITDTDGTLDDGNFQFDANVTPGNYVFSVTYTDETNSPTSVDKGRGSIVIKVITPADATGLDINDVNNNGIINEYDTDSLSDKQLQAELSNGTSYVLESDKGKVILGQAAFCAGKAARITQSDMASYAGTNCTAIDNSGDIDSLIGAGTGDYHDFEIHGLSIGDVVKVVIPLNTTLPHKAVYRKYVSSTGIWGTFITEDEDSIASASASNEGVCPAPNSTEYTPGLTKGDNCIQLTIADGGGNDADGLANGQILDPGTVAAINTGTEANLSSGCSISGQPSSLKNHSEWLLLLAAMAWLGLSARHRKQ